MALQIATVADSISKLSVTGVTLKDIDEIPTKGSKRGSFIIPLPDFATEFTHEMDSFGAGSDALQSVWYTLNYRLLYKPVGAGRVLVIAQYAGVITKASLFFDAVMAATSLTGSVEAVPASLTNMGLVNDPADHVWYGCDLAVRIREFVN